MQVQVRNTTLELVEGDITDLETDAIVNAANSGLGLGGGVAGAIRRKGGPTIQQECNRIGHCPVGGAVITGGGDLKARHVIHAVGPLGSDPDADALLADATRNSLALADQHNLKSIAFPAISTGIFGYPLDRCATVMLSTAIDYLKTADTGLDRVVFCLYGDAAFETFAQELKRQSHQ
jgi:O-acetyl-ADP-ribose deacetylase (regulator of RNase III)